MNTSMLGSPKATINRSKLSPKNNNANSNKMLIDLNKEYEGLDSSSYY